MLYAALALVLVSLIVYLARRSKATTPRRPMRVTFMRVTGFLRVDGPDGRREEQLPASPLGHGELPRAAWGPGDGSLYVVAKQYTGGDGADDGALYRRSPHGAWTTLHREPGRYFSSVAGPGDGTLYVGTAGGVLRFDGATWSLVPLPFRGIVEVWAQAGRVHAVSFDRAHGWLFQGAAAWPSDARPEASHDPRVHRENGVTFTVFDRSEEIGEGELGAREDARVRAELQQIGDLARREKLELRKPIR